MQWMRIACRPVQRVQDRIAIQEKKRKNIPAEKLQQPWKQTAQFHFVHLAGILAQFVDLDLAFFIE